MGGLIEGIGALFAELGAGADVGAGAAAGIGAGTLAGAPIAGGVVPEILVTAAPEVGAGLTTGELTAGVGGALTAAGTAFAGNTLPGVGGSGVATGVSAPNAPTSVSPSMATPSASGGATPTLGSSGGVSAGAPLGSSGGVSAGAPSGIPALSSPGVAPVDLTAGGAVNTGVVQNALVPDVAADNAALGTGVSGAGTGAGTGGVTVAEQPSLISKGIAGAINTIGGAGTATPAGVSSTLGIVQPAISGAGLLYNLLQGQPVTPKANQAAISGVESQASNLASQGSQLESYLANGTLPAGAQAAVNQATNAAKAGVRSAYASMGLSGSTMEQEALAQVDQQASAAVFNMGSSLLETGINETQLSSQLYSEIIGLSQQQSQQTGAAIANFAAALSGSTQNRTYTLTPAG